MIYRTEAMEKLDGYLNKHVIKVITGIRRCGKSTLMEMFRDQLKANGVADDQIVFLNFEALENRHLTDYLALYEHILARLRPDRMNYVFLDEIQNVTDFPKAVDSLFIRKNVDLYVTGSNATLLSGELATLLSGRYVEIRMLPFSFKEYLEFLGDRTDLNRKYADYLRNGSFPYTLELNKNPDLIRGYLEGLYNTVILKDILARRKISDAMLLQSVIGFMFDNVGNLCSTKKISDTLSSHGRKISTHTVEAYLGALKESFILYEAKRFDVKGKQHLKTLEKYYVVDIGLRNLVLGDRGTDVGHLLENVIYLELMRRGQEVSVGKVSDLEVDFVATGSGTTAYYQVAATVRDAKTLERELAPLRKIQDHYPKTLLTLDDDPPADYNGIRRLNALDFLLS